MFARQLVSTVRFSVASIALVASSILASPAHASFDAVTTVNTNNMEVVSLSFNGTTLNVYAGAFQTTLENASGMAVTSPLATYCVDLADELATKENVNVTSISNLAGGNGAYVGSLYANFAAGATSAIDSAALQLAIWKTEYDGPNATSNCGHVEILSAPQAVINQAIYYYENNKLVSNNSSYLQVVSGSSGQSFVGPNSSSLTPSSAVPEPASVTLLGIGLLAAVGTSIRRARRSITG